VLMNKNCKPSELIESFFSICPGAVEQALIQVVL
jgi:hypothetical protein